MTLVQQNADVIATARTALRNALAAAADAGATMETLRAHLKTTTDAMHGAGGVQATIAGDLLYHLQGAVNAAYAADAYAAVHRFIDGMAARYLRQVLEALPPIPLRVVLLTLFDDAGTDLDKMKENIEVWFNSGMDRVNGTFARKRPQASSLWADDMYMGIPALAEMGHLTGDKAWFDDAASNVLTMAEHLYNKQNNLFTHGWNANNPDAPRFYWAALPEIGRAHV